MIETREVCPPFGLLGPVSVRFDSGIFTALIGPNGAGKSTLLRTLAGLLAPTSGTVWTRERPLRDLSARERGTQIALVTQSETPLKGFSVRQSVSLGRYPHRSPWRGESRADGEAIDEALKATALSDLAQRDVSNLSGGEFQRVRIARALAQRAPILLLDEPTASLDLGHGAQFLQLVRDILRERELTVVAALHDLNLAGLFADRIMVMQDGKIHFDGEPGEALNAQRLSAVYNTELHGVHHPVTGRPQILVRGPDPVLGETP